MVKNDVMKKYCTIRMEDTSAYKADRARLLKTRYEKYVEAWEDDQDSDKVMLRSLYFQMLSEINGLPDQMSSFIVEAFLANLNRVQETMDRVVKEFEGR